MKAVIFACLLAVALAAPQELNPELARSENVQEENGAFRYGFQTLDGIQVDAEGTPGSEGQINIAGSYSFQLDNGRTMTVTYVADELGNRPVVTIS